VPPGDITLVTETEQPYGLRVELAGGGTLALTRLGRMRGRLYAELTEAAAESRVGDLLAGGVGRPEAFSGAVDGESAELRLYDDALVLVPAGGAPERIPYSFLGRVEPDASGYRLLIEVTGRAPLTVGRLARRTTEFQDLLAAGVNAAAVRTSAFLGALLPGLGALALRAAADVLRDGLAAPRAVLDGVDPTIWPVLLEATVRPDRALAVPALTALGEPRIGFKQIGSVERPAEGVRPWSDPAAPAHIGAHEGGSSGYGGPLRGAMLAGFQGPFGAMGPALALGMLGGGGGSGSRPMASRADVERGRLRPARTDLDALTVTGEEPTILAFLLCRTDSGRTVYEVLNLPGHATHVFAEEPSVVNRALDLIGFQVPAISAPDTAASRHRRAIERRPAPLLLRESLLGRIDHTADWPARLRALL
jgi:hypothetical protein